MGKLSNKEINMAEMLYDIKTSLNIIRLEVELPLLKVRKTSTVPARDSNFGWVKLSVVKDNKTMTFLYIHATKETFKFKGIKYNLSQVKTLAIEIYKDLDMEIEALLWTITK